MPVTVVQSCQVSRFTCEYPGFRADLQVSRLVLKISQMPLKWSFMHGLAPAPPPQFVGQTKQVGQCSLHSRAILAYYKEKWDKLCQFCEKLC
jgi:hypothetical protein